MTDRVAIYYRVSTADQSHESQVRERRHYAARRGLQVVSAYLDTAAGARTTRPELDRLSKGVRNPEGAIVLVAALGVLVLHEGYGTSRIWGAALIVVGCVTLGVAP